jgi:hypothetical protein
MQRELDYALQDTLKLSLGYFESMLRAIVNHVFLSNN